MTGDVHVSNFEVMAIGFDLFQAITFNLMVTLRMICLISTSWHLAIDFNSLFFSYFLFVIYFANQISQQVFMAPKKWNADHTQFSSSRFLFLFSVSALLGSVRGFHGYGARIIQELRVPPIEKRGLCLVADIVFEGIEELKGEFGQPSDEGKKEL